ncbi:MAG: YfcE family phosphodiesterase [Campylobacterales bacterium]|nr:YfcE family phosphodiesterase [Campylobacterales bacterium]
MIRIGILSDSHTKSELHKRALNYLLKKEVEYLIHAGDICTQSNIDALKATQKPFVLVRGNNDRGLSDASIKNEPYCFKIKEHTFKLMHLPYYLTPDSDIVIYGHTHHHAIEYKAGTLFLNSGEVCAREKDLSEVMVLEISNEHYRVIRAYTKPSLGIWIEEISRFER